MCINDPLDMQTADWTFERTITKKISTEAVAAHELLLLLFVNIVKMLFIFLLSSQSLSVSLALRKKILNKNEKSTVTNENVLLSVFFRLTIDVSILEARLIKVWATIWANLIESDEICCPTNCPLCLTHKDNNGWRVQDTGGYANSSAHHITSHGEQFHFFPFILLQLQISVSTTLDLYLILVCMILTIATAHRSRASHSSAPAFGQRRVNFKFT